ncbi:hypothetical protein D3C79_612480 [compost metagenome]
MAQAAQFERLFLVVLGVGRQLFAQALNRFVAGVQAFQLFHQALLQVRQLGGVHAVLARQGIDSVEAFFQGLQAHGVGVEVVEEAVELAHGFLDLDLRAGDQVGRFAQCLWRVGGGTQAVEAGGEGAEHIARIALAALVDDLAADAEQGFGAGQVLVFLLQLLQFVLAQAEVVQFFQLVAEQLVAGALLVARVGQALQLQAGLVPALGCKLYLAGQVDGTGILVKQAAVGVGLEQRLVLMLAVNVNQQLAERLEVAKRAGRAIDVAAAAAFGGDHPAQDARAVVVQVAFGQPGMRLGDVHQVEGGEDVCLVGAGAHHAAVGPVAQGQAEGVEHDRFAGTGLAGDDGHAAGNFEVEVLDDGVVVNGQVHQHGAAPEGSGLVIYTVLFSALTMPARRFCRYRENQLSP